MTVSMKRTALALTSLLFIATASQATTMLADKAGMTLYVFDRDAGGVSTCYDACAKMWPAYIRKADDKLTEGWTIGKRTDGTMQWAYDGKPVYFFANDKKKGDMAGDKMGGVWHVIIE